MGGLQIHQDQQGFIWFATYHGVVRWNGVDYQFARNADNGEHGRCEGPPSTLAEDPSGRLWVGYLDGSLCTILPGTLELHRLPIRLETPSLGGVVRLLAVSSDTLLATAGGRVLLLQVSSPDSIQVQEVAVLPSENFPAELLARASGAVLVQSEALLGRVMPPYTRLDTLLYLPEHRATKEFYVMDPSSTPPKGWTDQTLVGPRIWLTTWRDGLWSFDPRTGSLRQEVPFEKFDGVAGLIPILHGSDGAIWTGGLGGLFRYDPASSRLLRIPIESEEDAKPPFPLELYEDRQGILWIGTWDETQFRIDLRSSGFQLVENAFSPGTLAQSGFVDLWDGRVLAGGREGIFEWRPGASNDIRDPQNWMRSPDLGPGVMTLGPERVLWHVSTDGVLASFVPCGGEAKRWCRTSSFPLAEAFVGVRSMAVGPFGAVWLANERSGLIRVDPETGAVDRFRPDLPPPRQLPEGYVNDIEIGEDGMLWVASAGDSRSGISRVDPRTLQVEEVFGTPGQGVFALYRDPNASSRLWLGGPGGLASFDTEQRQLTRYPVSESVTCILGLVSGHVWAVGIGTIFRFDPATGISEYFGARSGIRGYDLVNGAHCARHADGLMSVVGRRYYVFDPEQLKVNRQPAELSLTGLTLYDPASGEEARRMNLAGAPETPVSLSYRQNTVTFSYTAIHGGSPEDIQFRYRLEGQDVAWTDAGAVRLARYANLGPGTYTFELQATNGYDVWGEPKRLLTIRIAAPWWRSWWGVGLMALAAVLALFGFNETRTRSLRRRARQLDELVGLRTRELAEEKAVTERQARHLEELGKAKDRLLANLSHEFRTPLTLIEGPAQDILEGRFGPASSGVKKQQEIIRRNARRLLTLVDQLLSLARMREPGARIKREDVEVITACRHLVDSYRPLAERCGVRLVFQSSPEMLPARLDPELLDKGVGNLISNAIKFSGEDTEVEVFCGRSGPERKPDIAFSVSDRGPGLDPDTIDHLFERFYQGAQARSGAGAGVGIGLALAKELTSLHGGSIRADNRPDGGTVFTIQVPLIIPSDGSPQGVSKAEADVSGTPGLETHGGDRRISAPEARDGRPFRRILIVEDNDEVRAYIARHLAEFELSEARDGEEGLDLARALKPDLILSDVMMPRLDGFEMCRLVKANRDLRTIPVILLTARAGVEATIEGLRSGADAFMTKPFDTEELRARIEAILASRAVLKESYRTSPTLPEPEYTSSDEAFLNDVLRVIDENLVDAGFSVDRLAEELGKSRRQLERRLKPLLSETPAALIRRLRLERASQMLAKGAGTVGEVAYRVGFRSTSHFTQVFRKTFGILPTERRREVTVRSD